MGLPTGSLDSSRVEETYNWRDDVMEITRRIDEARLSNIANHFEVDLSEIRAFLEMKQQQQQKPQTNADRIRSSSDEELAELWWEHVDCGECPVHRECKTAGKDCKSMALDWLRQEET